MDLGSHPDGEAPIEEGLELDEEAAKVASPVGGVDVGGREEGGLQEGLGQPLAEVFQRGEGLQEKFAGLGVVDVFAPEGDEIGRHGDGFLSGGEGVDDIAEGVDEAGGELVGPHEGLLGLELVSESGAEGHAANAGVPGGDERGEPDGEAGGEPGEGFGGGYDVAKPAGEFVVLFVGCHGYSSGIGCVVSGDKP